MKYSCRIYKMYDLDILGILDMGYALGPLFARAVTAYAHGETLRLSIPDPQYLDSNDIKTYMFHINIPDEDTQTNNFLRSVKYRQRNALFKAIFRNSLIAQHTSALFSNEDLIEFERRQQNDVNLLSLPGVQVLDDSFKRKRVVNVLNHQIEVLPKQPTAPVTALQQKAAELVPKPPNVEIVNPANSDEPEEIFFDI